jgi:hypothetical protein
MICWFCHLFTDMLDLRKENVTKSDIKMIPHNTRSIYTCGIYFWNHVIKIKHLAKLRQLTKRINNNMIERIIIPLICVNSKISLRLINWFVISYCKQEKLCFLRPIFLNVYESYRQNLKYWKRDTFDAFRRGHRIYFTYQGITYSTTVAQLNYIFWIYDTQIMHYVLQHVCSIKTRMSITTKQSTKTLSPICVIYKQKRLHSILFENLNSITTNHN